MTTRPDETTTTATPVSEPRLPPPPPARPLAAGDDLATRPTAATVEFPAVGTLAEHDTARLEIETYVAGQIYTRPEWQVFEGMVTPVSEFLNRLALQHPEVRDMVTEDLGAALAMSDDDFRAAVASGVPQADLSLMVDAVLQELLIPGAEFAYARDLLADGDAIRGNYQAASVDRTLVRRAVTAQLEETQPELFTQGLQTLATDPLVGEWTHALADRPGEWAFDGEFLAGSVEIEVAGQDPGLSEFLIRLDEGTNIKSDLEAQAAMVLAFTGLAHNVEGGELAGAQSNAGKFIETVVGPWSRSDAAEQLFISNVISHPGTVAAAAALHVSGDGPDASAPTQEQALAMVETALPDHQRLGIMVYALDAELRAEGIIVAAPEIKERLEEGLSADDIDRMKNEDAEKIIAEAEQAGVDPGNLLTASFDQGVETLMQTAELWEGITQWIGVQTIDFFVDFFRTGQALAPGNPDSAWDALKETVRLSETETVGDYFGLRGSARSWANLGASVVFDPLNFAFAGGAAKRVMMEALVTNPALAPMAMRSRAMTGMVDTVMEVAAEGGDDAVGAALRALMVMDKMRSPAVRRISDLVESGNFTREAIEKIFMNELPSAGTGGEMIMASFGHATRRNTVLGMSDLFRHSGDVSDEGVNKIAATFMMLSDDPTRPIRGVEAFDAFKRSLVSLFPDDSQGPVIARWLREWDNGAAGSRTIENLQAVKTQHAQRLEEIRNTEIPGAPGNLSQGYDLRGVRSQIDSLERSVDSRSAAGFVESQPGEDIIFSEGVERGMLAGEEAPTIVADGIAFHGISGSSDIGARAARVEEEGLRQGGFSLSAERARDFASFSLLDEGQVALFRLEDLPEALQRHLAEVGDAERVVSPTSRVGRAKLEWDELTATSGPIGADDIRVQELNEFFDERGLIPEELVVVDTSAIPIRIVPTSEFNEALERGVLSISDPSGPTTNILSDELARLRDIEDQIVNRRQTIDDLKPEVQHLTDEIHRIESYLAQPFAEAETVIFWNRFYDEVAEEYGVPHHLDPTTGEKVANPYAPDLFQRDWSVVSTSTSNADEIRRAAYGQHEEINRITGIVPDPVDPAAAKELVEAGQALNPLAQRSYYQVPVSEWELVAFRAMGDDAQKFARFRSVVRRLEGTKAHAALRTMFNTNLLINLSTPLKTRLDESLRLLWETGNITDFLKSTASFFPTPGGLSPGGTQFAREVGGITSTQHGFQLIDNPRPGRGVKGWQDNAQRFLDGSLGADDLAQQWARTQADFATPDEVAAWWSETGQTLYADRQLTLGFDDAGEPIIRAATSGDDPLQAFDTLFREWVDSVIDDPKIRRKFIDLTVDVLNGQTTFSSSRAAGLIRHIKKLPGSGVDAGRISGSRAARKAAKENLDAVAPSQADSGVLGPFWNTLYGRPGQRSGGVFYDNYFEFADNLYTKAAQNNGRLLTPQMLSERFDVTIEDATSMLKRGARDPRMRDVFAQGYLSPYQIRVQASSYAKHRADDLMYSLVSRSIAGSRLDSPLLLPFVRAQTDFLSYWSRQFTEGSITRIPRETLQAWTDGNVFARAGAGAVQTVENLPINVRLMARWAELSAAANEEDAPPGSPGWFLNRFTFLPLRGGPGFLMQVIPQPGISATVPWWWMDNKLDSPQWMETVERAWPSLGFADNLGQLEERDLIGIPLPSSDRTVLGTIGNVFGTLAKLPGNAGDMAEGISNQLLEQSEPPGLVSAMRVAAANSDIWTMTPGGDEFNQAVEQIGFDTRDGQSFADGWRGLLGQVPGLGDPAFAADHLELYMPLITPTAEGGWLEIMDDNGKILEADREALFGVDGELGLVDRFRQGIATEDELIDLLDLFSTLLFDRAADVDVGPARPKFNADGEEIGTIPGLSLIDAMLVATPELSVNLVSTQRCMPQQGGGFFSGEFCSADGRLINVPVGQAGRDLRSEWRRSDKIGYRLEGGEDGWLVDAALRVETARGRVARYLWSTMTGREYGQDSGGDNLLKRIRDGEFTVTDGVRQRAEQIDLILPTGTVTGRELRESFAQYFDGLTQGDVNAGFWRSPVWTDMASNHEVDMDGNPVLWSAERIREGRQSLQDFMKQNGVSLYDLPESVKENMRENVFLPALDNDVISEVDYARHAQRIFGPLSYEPPQPPTDLDSPDIDFRRTFGPQALNDGNLIVLDGDTLRAVTDSGEGFVDFRLVGINTPEEGQIGAVESSSALREFLRAADTIDFIIFDPERFGRVQTFAGGRQRIKVWLYVNGVPIWDPAAFGSSNPTGAAFGGAPVDYASILESNGGTLTPSAETEVS